MRAVTLLALATMFALAEPLAHETTALISPFSAAKAGIDLPRGWRVLGLPHVPSSRVVLDDADGTSVLHVESQASAGSAAFVFNPPAQAARLAWRWKVDRVIEHADLATRPGDDFAARVYVFFDVPPAELPWRDRVKLQLARLLHGKDVPAAGICYVWDNTHRVGTIAPNPYVPQIRTFVLESGAAGAGRWQSETRDLAADFRSAFPERSARVPRVTGIAAGNDTDQTGGRANAWFGDFTWERPS